MPYQIVEIAVNSEVPEAVETPHPDPLETNGGELRDQRVLPPSPPTEEKGALRLQVVHRTLPDLSENTVRERRDAITRHTVWIVPPTIGEDIAKLKLSGLIADRGTKHHAIELSRRLLIGDESASPLIRAEYASPGKLISSVRTLLGNAPDSPRRLFIIQVPPESFAEIGRRATVRDAAVSPQPFVRPADGDLDSASEKTGARVGPLPPFRGPTGAVLNLLEIMDESPALRRDFIGESGDAYAVRQLIMRAAKVDDTVLITGETGTGKEVIARQIHAHSRRKQALLLAVNCGALPENLLESELFGHEKGSFTGAYKRHIGLWEAAGDGSLFLDEIGELPPSQQVKMLRGLQEKRIRRVGGTEEIKVNARVICATNRDLFAMVQAGQFRQDLYYRLRDFPIGTAPLREHPEDIPLLALALWRKTLGNQAPVLADDVVNDLIAYSWPGNVRELKTFLTQLHGFFGQDPMPLGSQKVQALFRYLGIRVKTEHPEPTPVALSPQTDWPATFRRLRATYETVRTIEHQLSPLLNAEGPQAGQSPHISTEIAKFLNELDQHERRPEHFSAETFYHLSLLRSRLEDWICGSLRSPGTVPGALRHGIRNALDATVAGLLADLDRALRKLF